MEVVTRVQTIGLMQVFLCQSVTPEKYKHVIKSTMIIHCLQYTAVLIATVQWPFYSSGGCYKATDSGSPRVVTVDVAIWDEHESQSLRFWAALRALLKIAMENHHFTGFYSVVCIIWIDFGIYPFVNIQKAFEHGHWNRGFTRETFWFSIALFNYQTVYQ